jgi:hypothetical protein
MGDSDAVRRNIDAVVAEERSRRARGWQTRAAARLGITQSYLSQILSGKRDLDNFGKQGATGRLSGRTDPDQAIIETIRVLADLTEVNRVRVLRAINQYFGAASATGAADDAASPPRRPRAVSVARSRSRAPSGDKIQNVSFDLWLHRQPRGTFTRIARETGLSRMTLWRARTGQPLAYRAAVSLSAATGGEISVAALCAPTDRKRTNEAVAAPVPRPEERDG